MGDPAYCAPNGEERGRASDRQRQRAGNRDQSNIDRWPAEATLLHRVDQREYRLDFRTRTAQVTRDLDQQCAARIGMGRIDWMCEALDDLATPLAIVHDLLDPFGRAGLEKKRVDTVCGAPVSRSRERSQRCQQASVNVCPRRCDDARGKRRSVQLMVGRQHERAVQRRLFFVCELAGKSSPDRDGEIGRRQGCGESRRCRAASPDGFAGCR